jgi:hypothetical protein
VSFAVVNLCVASQRVFIIISLSTQSGNFWIHPRTKLWSEYVKGRDHSENLGVDGWIILE